MGEVDLNELSKAIHQDNVDRGFFDDERQIGTLLMLTVSELAEALEADRKDRHCTESGSALNADGTINKELFEKKFKDTFIRLFDLCGYLNIDIQKHISLKLEYNKTRGYKHGKNY